MDVATTPSIHKSRDITFPTRKPPVFGRTAGWPLAAAVLQTVTTWCFQCRQRRGLACYSISYHAFAVSAAEAWHAILSSTPWQYLQRLGLVYPITPWQYLPRLGMLFCILSLLGSVCRGLACYAAAISYHALAVSAAAEDRHMLSRHGKYEYMYMKNIVKSYMKSGIPRFQSSRWKSLRWLSYHDAH